MKEQSRWQFSDIKSMPLVFGSVFCEACSEDVTEEPVTPAELEKILRLHRLTCRPE